MKTRIDKKEFTCLLEQNQGIIRKVAFLYTHSPEDKADLFQDICLQLWKSYSSYRGEAFFSTWMYRVAINTAISKIRKNRTPLFAAIHPDQISAPHTQEDSDPKRMLFEAISQLNQIDKAIILLWLEEKKI